MSQSDTTRELRNMAEEGRKKPGCCRRHPVACGVTLLVVGALGLAVVGVALGVHPTLKSMFKKTVNEQAELTKGSEGTSQFESSSAPLYSKFYFFNVTNADDVTNKGSIPNVVQCGPYTYRENRTKFNLKWNDNETMVTYDLNVTYTFDASQSAGDPTTAVITTVNIPLYVFLLKIEEVEESDIPDYLKALVEDVVKYVEELFGKFAGEQGLFMKTTVHQLLFGYDDPILTKLNKYVNTLAKLFPEFKKYAPNPFFGLENITEVEKNNTVYTGKGDVDKLGQFVVWNGNTEIYPHGGWGSPYAKMINGTGGFMFHPGVSRHEDLTAFISELYRSGYFAYEKDESLYGIGLYRFNLPAVELLNTSQDPGFYPNGPSGVLNLTSVFPENAPVFASKPHFLDAFAGYRANVSGMDPDRSLHDSHLDVEPITGAVLRAAKRIQINLRMTSNSHFTPLEHLMPELMMPVFWASEEGQLTSSLANEFKKKVYGAEYGIEAGVYGAVGLGGLVFLLSMVCLVGLTVQQCRHRRPRRHTAMDDERTALLYTTN